MQFNNEELQEIRDSLFMTANNYPGLYQKIDGWLKCSHPDDAHTPGIGHFDPSYCGICGKEFS